MFEHEAPYYLSIGMTYQEYWNGDVWSIVDARRADKLRADRKNQELWLQGMYFYEAMGAISPLLHAFAKKGTHAAPYRAEPYPIGGEKPKLETEQDVENERLKATLFFKNWARANRNAGK